MAVSETTRPPEPGNPLAILFEAHCAAALQVTADHEHGLVMVSLAAEPRCLVTLAPEVALDLSLHLGQPRQRPAAQPGRQAVTATCAVCGHPFRAKRRDARLCSARCRQRASRAGKGEHVTDNTSDDAPGPVTGPEAMAVDAALEAWANRRPATIGDLSLAEANRLVEEAPAPRLPWWRRPERRPRCRYCDMPIRPGEPVEAGYHTECKRYVETKGPPAMAPAAKGASLS
jgi:hypothetical protein